MLAYFVGKVKTPRLAAVGWVVDELLCARDDNLHVMLLRTEIEFEPSGPGSGQRLVRRYDLDLGAEYCRAVPCRLDDLCDRPSAIGCVQ